MCFDISSGFHGDMVFCKGHDEFSVGFLKFIMFNKGDIFLRVYSLI